MKRFFAILSILSIFSMSVAVLMDSAQAAGITALTDTMTRAKKSVAANHTIVFTTASGMAIADTVTLTFASDFDVSAVVLGDVTIGGNAPSAVGVLGQVITITIDADTVVAPAGTATIVIGNSHIINATTEGSFTVSIAGTGTFVNTGSFALAVSDNDQVASSGTVNPYLYFDVTDVGPIAFGTLSITAIKNDTAAMEAATNSTLGYNITVGITGADTATLDDGAGHTITAIGAVHAASAPGTEQYGLKIAAAGGSGAAVDPYDDPAEYALATGAFPDICATSAGVSATTTFTMTYMSNIAATTEPGTYTARHTYVATGNF